MGENKKLTGLFILGILAFIMLVIILLTRRDVYFIRDNQGNIIAILER